MNNNVFENILIADFYIRYQEKKNKFQTSHLDKFFYKIKKEVCTLEEALLVDDKDRKAEAVKEKIASLFATDSEMSDSKFYALLYDDADWEQIIKLLSQIIKRDGIISSKERKLY